MARASVFLLGGGWNDVAYPHTYGRFAAAAASAGTGGIACVLLDHPDRDTHLEWARSAFAAVGFAHVFPRFVAPDRPLQPADLDGASGIFVGGGLTPDYHAAIVPAAREWLPRLLDQGIPYAGISAGAMIAADLAIVGGWKLQREGSDLVICSGEVSEDEVYLDVRPGLGLVPFAVDAHASQYGTPTRLLHAVRAGLVEEGWAIDEETMIEVGSQGVVVTGLGSAYNIGRQDGRLTVEIHEASSPGGTAG